MKPRTLKDTTRRSFMAFLRVLPDTQEDNPKARPPYAEATDIVEGALAKLTAKEINALERVTRNATLLHKETK